MRRSRPVLLALGALLLVCLTLNPPRRRAVAAPAALPPAEPEPRVDGFEAVRAGESVLLRVHGENLGDEVLLIVDGGEEMDVLTALPAPVARGALGFATAAEALAGDVTFWLQLPGRTLTLETPVEKLLA